MNERNKTTMSVPEMWQMLGLGKTGSYWLVHKQYFDIVMVAGRMRVVIESFNHWYSDQSKYRKLSDRCTKSPPARHAVTGANKTAFTLRETAAVLDLSYNEVRRLIHSGEIEAGKYGNMYMVRKDDITWYLLLQKLEHENGRN